MLKVVIDENECVGCTKCIEKCPVDAIVGALQWMHTVIQSECIGCKLCIAPCPVDCIKLIEVENSEKDNANLKTKARIKFRKQRLKAEQIKKQTEYLNLQQTDKQLEIAAALARFKAKNAT